MKTDSICRIIIKHLKNITKIL
ncbi:MAG: hypothetical protein IJ642_10030 [Oscillospiraceae bacterium]|nr:hypothetical protein [Oscillospiraceae bacterium]